MTETPDPYITDGLRARLLRSRFVSRNGGIKLRAFARAAGVSESSVYKWLGGEKTPSPYMKDLVDTVLPPETVSVCPAVSTSV